MTNQKKIVVAMSGGVDSSVAAALLVKGKHNVIGVMLELWSAPSTENLCCTPNSMRMAREVAAQLGIPLITIDAKNAFRKKVVDYFIHTHQHGQTPNPCIVCNQQVRWEILQTYANQVGADFIATGHYARLQKESDGRTQLLRGYDRTKDQSYVLYSIPQESLSRTLFPLGTYKKSEVRQIAREFFLPVSERPDSQDLCFVGNLGYHNFLVQQAPNLVRPGPIFSIHGEILGEHRGLAFYTIGQRKGLGIAAPKPYYVIRKDVDQNHLIVGLETDLGKDEATIAMVSWVSGEPLQALCRVAIKIRYKAREVWGWITPLDQDKVHIKFEKHLRDITPGQSAVFYDDEVCLGGGIIT
jgi:tRNA-specific 2-thiouridylase